MSKKVKKVGTFILTGLISISLIAGAYAAIQTNSDTQKIESHSQSFGKNWEIKGGEITISQKKAQPKKNIKQTPEQIVKNKLDRESRPFPSRKPVPPTPSN